MIMFDLSNPFRSRAAQITLPAILLIPTILLVIYLLFETTKLSREKIRHQFALDSSAFVEMTSTSNFLNAVAYTNGAFPFRLFRENYAPEEKDIKPDEDGPLDDKRAKAGDSVSLWDAFHEAGAFPTMYDPNSSPQPNAIEWKLEFYNDSENPSERAKWNTDNPDPAAALSEEWPLTSKNIAMNFLFEWNVDAVKMYMFMYYLLSQIYENQKKVYDKISSEGEFFRKSYYLNTGNCRMSECGREGARSFKGFAAQTESMKIQKVIIWYKDPDDLSVQSIAIDLKKESIFDGTLYQFSFISRGSREKIRRLFTGIDITQPFVAPNNYFNINLARFKPHTHVRVALQCTKESNNCVWPNPTPKYQVRVFP